MERKSKYLQFKKKKTMNKKSIKTTIKLFFFIYKQNILYQITSHYNKKDFVSITSTVKK